MNVSRAVVDRLVANGIDTVFGIPGKQTLPLNETIDERDDIRFVMARHETAVTHQAWGYAEASGDLAATVVVPGPGDMNAMNGLKNAYNDCTPLVHFAVETSPELRGGDPIHETPPDTYDNVVKSNVLVERPESTAVVVEEAIATATTPPYGPVRVGIPKPFLPQDVPVATPGEYDRTHLDGVSRSDLEAAANALAASETSVIFAGGGVRAADASQELERVARLLDAPVVTSYKGKGVLPEGSEYSAGTLSASAPPELLECLASADAALAVGTDLDAVTTREWQIEFPETVVHVTLDPADLGNGYEPTVGIVADAKETLSKLREFLDGQESGSFIDSSGESTTATRSGLERATAVREALDDRLEELRGSTPPLTSVSVLEAVRDAVPRDAIVTADAGGFRVWGLNAFDVYSPRTYVNPGSWASMGTALPAGIGAQLSNPTEDIVVLVGDGGLMMCVHELHTAVAEDLPITVVVSRNEDYALISEEAGRSYDLEDGAYAWPDAPIDFVSLANSLGMTARRARTPAEIRQAVAEAVAANEPTLLEIPTDPQEPQAGEWMTKSEPDGGSKSNGESESNTDRQ
ncbi:acetolactate synthase [Halostagnicola larsenii XH-48]|uniref:Acetolactate synthase n=1 Tax=Halostagnicola larsenii XH-48 TaxID=797299 RepID=W0JI97_9EURY|nr:thiamine pyrophosphate-binding protein [Halostagnicola larsenii]AHF98445.1 acetolactate synthase [Halostagnicola larsenii XH-48]